MNSGKFVAITVLVFLSVCLASEVNKSTWWKVTSCRLATRNVVVAGTRNQLTNYTLIYPEVNWTFQIFKQVNWKQFNNKRIFPTKKSVSNSWDCFNLLKGRQSQYQIVGIEHLDHEFRPVSVTILKGGVGQQNATIQIQSQRSCGINSTFIFYTFKKFTF